MDDDRIVTRASTSVNGQGMYSGTISFVQTARSANGQSNIAIAGGKD
jgi:hypothetical protein